MPSAGDPKNSLSASALGDLVFAIDTGGTKTAAWLVEADWRRLVSPRRPGSHRRRKPIERWLRESRRGDSRSVHASSRIGSQRPSPGECRPLYRRRCQSRHERAVYRLGPPASGWPNACAIVSDVLPILAAGTPDCYGVALDIRYRVFCLRPRPGWDQQTLWRLGLFAGRRGERLRHGACRAAVSSQESGRRHAAGRGSPVKFARNSPWMPCPN